MQNLFEKFGYDKKKKERMEGEEMEGIKGRRKERRGKWLVETQKHN